MDASDVMLDNPGNSANEFEPLPRGFWWSVGINVIALVLIIFIATELVLAVSEVVN